MNIHYLTVGITVVKKYSNLDDKKGIFRTWITVFESYCFINALDVNVKAENEPAIIAALRSFTVRSSENSLRC